jgi:hypothetical protein
MAWIRSQGPECRWAQIHNATMATDTDRNTHRNHPLTSQGWCVIVTFVLAIATGSATVARTLHSFTPREAAPRQSIDASSISARDVTRIQIRVARGSLKVRHAAGSRIEVRTTRHSASDNPLEVIVRRTQANGVVRFVAVHPAPPLQPSEECLVYDDELGDFWHHDVTVDVELRIPSHVELWLRTMRGDVDVTGLTGAVDVATNDGTVRLSELEGDVKTWALGDVHMDWSSRLSPASHSRRLSAYRGDIRLWLPDGEPLHMTDGRTVHTTADQVEVARSDDWQGVALSVGVGRLKTPIDVELNRGRLIMMPGRPTTRRTPQ